MNDTVMGGEGTGFPTTIWSDILSAGDPAHPGYRDRWNRLIQAYWKPVYAFVRARWRKQVEDAKDLTQAFFTYFMQKDYLTRMRPERGSFRGYLRQALRHFLIDAARYQSAREPDGKLFPLEARPEEFDQIGIAGPGETPEQVFDRQWFETVFDAAVEDLHTLLQRQGKERYFPVFRAYCLEDEEPVEQRHRSSSDDEPAEGPTYESVAQKLGVKETDVRNYLFFCRNALRNLLRARIRDYVSTEAEVDEELSRVLGR